MLGALSDCQAACLTLPPEQQAPCMNDCLAQATAPTCPKPSYLGWVVVASLLVYASFVAGTFVGSATETVSR